MTVHISCDGMVEDEQGFFTVTCDCRTIIGPAPDVETMLDMAMEHAWQGGVEDGRAESLSGGPQGGGRPDTTQARELPEGYGS